MNSSIKSDISFSLIYICLVVLGNLPITCSVIVGVIVIAAGIFYFVKCGKTVGTLINAKGLFALSWMVSSGMSMLRIHPNQTNWTPIAVLCIGIALPAFFVGYDLFHAFHKKSQPPRHLEKRMYSLKIMYPICIIVILGLLVDAVYSHGLPIFSKSMSAYMDFGMPKLHYITVFCCIIPSLYFCLCKAAGMGLFKNRILLALVAFCALIPVLIVSRQLLLLELVLLIFSILIFAHKENLIKIHWIILALVGCIGFWLVMSLFRNQSSAYLIDVFNLPHGISDMQTSLWQLYLYISFNFDNFNYLTEHMNNFTLGVNTAFPILALSGTKDFVPAAMLSSEGLRALPTYTTYPFIEPAFRDFGIIGVILYAAAIGCFAAMIEHIARNTTDPTLHMMYYLTLYSLIICFFTSEFVQPVFWVYLLLLLLIKLFEYRTINISKLSNRFKD